MRISVAIRTKNHVPAGTAGPLRELVAKAYSALGALQPWKPENTVEDNRWVPPEGRVALLFRSNEPETIPERGGWISHKRRAWAWSGVISNDLHGALTQSTADSNGIDAPIWSGIGSYAVVGTTADTLTAYTNAHRSEALFWIELPDAVVVSNSAATLAHILGNGKIDFSPLGIAGFLMHALPVTDTIPYAGVNTVPASAKLSSDRSSDLRITYDQIPANNDASAAYDDIASGLVEYAKVLTAGVSDIRAAVTGGKDSRLVVSTLHAAGAAFSTYTNGLPESGEAYIGKQVAETLGAPHRLVTPPIRTGAQGKQVVVGKPEEQAWMTLRSTGGLGNAFTTLPNPENPHMSVLKTANFGGQGGEIIRGGFQRRLGGAAPTRDNARAELAKTWLNNQDLLNPLAVEAVKLDLHGLLEAPLGDPGRALFEGYVTHRTGRWLATMRHGESVVNAHTTLLINNQMVRQLRALPAEALLGERMAHGVMNVLAPDVAALPFFRDRWAFEQDAATAHYRPESWDSRAPYTAHDQPRATFNWRSAYSRDLSAYFKDYVLSDAQSLLFDVIDRKAVERMFDGHRYRAPAAWALYSVQYMLSGAWMGPKPESPETIEIEVPA